jgi:hypothetical protein
MERDQHCVFCGEVVSTNWPPDPKKDWGAMICHSTRNTMTPDTFGNRYHATLPLDHPAIGHKN